MTVRSETVPPYEPTEQERAAAQRFRDRKSGNPPAPKYAVKTSGSTVTIDPDHPDTLIASMLLADMLCTTDIAFMRGINDQLAYAARTGKELKAADLNFMLSTIRGIGPRDQTEALLAVQMAAIHNATMTAARRLNHVENIPQQDSASNMLNKLARTFVTQLEALKRYRSTGEQCIRVQHVNVSANQAVVGFNQGGGASHEKPSQSHAPSEFDERSPALLSQEQALGVPLPGAGREGQECVPHARRPRRSTNGKS